MRRLFTLFLSSMLVALLVSCSSTTTSSSSLDGGSTKDLNNPKAAEYNVQLGVGYLRQGNYERAKQKLLLALKQNPKSATANSAMAYFLEKTGEFARAEYYYKAAISLADDTGASENNYGTFLCRRGRYQEAEKEFVSAAADPNYLKPANAYENAGLCAMLIPDPKKAAQYFEAALQKNPNMSTSEMQLADIYYGLGDYDKSYKYLALFLKNNQPTAESLWLGVRLATQRGDRNSATSYGLLLKSQFPNSKQYQEYLTRK